MRTFSLITIHRTNPNGSIDGAWLQDHVGTLASAREKADATSALNHDIPIAVVLAVPFCGPAEVFTAQQRLA